MEKLNFRNQEVSYIYHWLDDDTFIFDFGDGEFTDSENLAYFLHLEYHVKDNEWVIEIWWEDDTLGIDELDKMDSDEYITEQEVEEVKEFAKKFIDMKKGDIFPNWIWYI